MIAPARAAALQALRAIDAGQADLPAALAASRQHLSDPRDRALALEIVTGTLRWQRSADFLVEQLSRRTFESLDRDVVLILRLTLYQLLHLDRVPASAAVDDAVNLCRTARHTSAAGFVNAVLRTTLRQRRRLPLPARPADAADTAAALRYLGITLSHPDWLVARWMNRYGFDAAEAWARFDNESPSLTIRANTLKTTREALQAGLSAGDVETIPTRYAPLGLMVQSGNPLSGAPDGSFVVQDESSQLVPLVVGARPGETVLDLCASPGGKTTALAADMMDRGVLVASDVRPRRMRLLAHTVAHSGATIVRLVHLSASGALPMGAVFDRVLVDAPCSGLGTLRRDPDIRWRRQESELAALGERQQVLLARAADVVKPGGRLVYATCSSEPEENESVVRWFLQAHPHFAPIDLRDEFAAAPALVDRDGMFRTLPFEHGLEAFFAAALRRTG